MYESQTYSKYYHCEAIFQICHHDINLLALVFTRASLWWWWWCWIVLWYGWPMKDFKHYFQPGPLSDILTIANLWHTASSFWTGKRTHDALICFHYLYILLVQNKHHNQDKPLQGKTFNFLCYFKLRRLIEVRTLVIRWPEVTYYK